MDQKERIQNKARELFLTHGYSKTTMSSLAKSLGMSKKTVYSFFQAKEDLLEIIIDTFLQKIEQETRQILDNTEWDFPEKVKKVFILAGTRLSSINPYFLDDINRNTPNIWLKLQKAKQDIAFKGFYKLLEDGIKRGYIKKEINISLAVLMYISAIETLIIPSFTKQIPAEMMPELPYSAKGIFEGVTDLIFAGIAVEKKKHIE